MVGEVDGVGGAGGNGGRSAALSASRRRGGAAEVREDGVVATSEGERTAPVSSAYKEGRGRRFALPNKEPPTISPTTPHSTRAVRGGRGGYGVRYGVTQAARARALFWAWPNSARHRVWPRPGGSCRCTKVGALLLTPLLVHGQSEPPAAATHNRARKGSRREAEGTRQTRQCQGPRPQSAYGRSRFPRQGPFRG